MTRYHRHKQQKHHTLVVKETQKNTRWIDRATFAAAIIEPLVTIPQAYDIFRSHTAAGVSMSTWLGYEVLTVIWLWYAIVHKERMILVYQGLFMIIQTVVIIGGLMYHAPW
jgi:uncharacterized protein with PQ loop repeat